MSAVEVLFWFLMFGAALCFAIAVLAALLMGVMFSIGLYRRFKG
jgi:hypothetical protein